MCRPPILKIDTINISNIEEINSAVLVTSVLTAAGEIVRHFIMLNTESSLI